MTQKLIAVPSTKENLSLAEIKKKKKANKRETKYKLIKLSQAKNTKNTKKLNWGTEQ